MARPSTRSGARRKRPVLTARTADRHDLYQRSVQDGEFDARFYSRWFEKLTGQKLRRLREDFCGTALLCCHHIKLHPDNTAVGIDLHGPTLDWGRTHNVAKLLKPEQQQRLTLLQQDVRDRKNPRAQTIVAGNFSYSVFQTRKDLGGYVQSCFRQLEPGGLFFMDAWGGGETYAEQVDRSRRSGFTYLWDQSHFNPLTHHAICKIHYEFPDGTRLKDAFVYDWRLWTLPELQELMTEAGFTDIVVLWEGTDRKTNLGNGKYRITTRGEACPAWVAYVVGRKPSGKG